MRLEKISMKKIFLLFSFVLLCSVFVKPMNCEAYTAKSINKEIKKVSKQIKILTKKHKAERKGLISVGGSIVNYNPLIVKDITNNYYWVNNSKAMNTFLGVATGSAKDTGKTKVFYKDGVRYTCKVAVGKKVNTKTFSKLQSMEKKLTKLKNTKKNRLFISSSKISLVKGQKYNIKKRACWLYADAYNQKVSFSSSKKSVASINKKTGQINAKKVGSTTITIKARISGKKTKVKINVVPPYIKFPKTSYEFTSRAHTEVAYIDVSYCSLSENISISIEDTSIISSAENTADGIKCTYTGKTGQTKLTAKIKEGLSATCIIKVKEPYVDGSSDSGAPVITNDPSEHTHEMEMRWNEDFHWKQCRICNEIQGHEMHTWIYDEDESVEPTVDNVGYKLYYCDECFKEKKVEVPKLQHQCYNYLEVVQEKQATCTEEGNIKYYKCTFCDKLYYEGYPLREVNDINDVVIEKKSHVLSDEWNTDKNYHWKACTTCNEVNILTKQVHIWGGKETILEPTETQKGIEKYTCTVCGKTKEEEVDALGHICANHLTKIEEKAAACEEDGNVLYYTCECGKWYWDDKAKEEIIQHSDVIREKTTHKYGEWEKDEDYHWKSCVECGAIDTKNKQKHTWDAGEVLVEPTETEKGTAKYTCTVCGKTQERDVDALGHICAIHLTKIEEKAATCEEDGNILYYTCECGKWYYDQDAKKEITNHNDITKAQIAHSYGDEWEKDEEYHWRACSACGKTDDLTKQEHTWDAGEVIAEPTETETGLMKYTCVTCGKIQEKEIEVLHICAHHLTKVEEKESTCEEEGNDLYYTCECGKWYYDQEAKEAITNHNDVTKAKTAHSYGEEWKKNEEYHWRACSACGEIDDLTKQEHTWDVGEVITEPTETETGLMKYTCITCGETKEKEIEVLHACIYHLTRVEKKEPTSEKGGNILYYVCSCGKWYYDQEAKEEITNHDEVVVYAGLYIEINEKEELIYTWKELLKNEIVKINEQNGICSFQSNEKRTHLIIPKGVTSIGKEAFKNCISLTSIDIPEGVTSIGDYAFLGCSGLTSISIPEGVTRLGAYVFKYCESLTSISIPKGVTSIEDEAFSECSGLTSINIPEEVTSIGDCAFYRCSGLTSICIPKGVTSIGDYAFLGCSGLTSISIPKGVTSIGTGVFSGCSGLTSISIPEEVTSIGGGAFYACRGLTSISIPEGVTSIGDEAFYACSGLTSISIPKGVTSIGTGVFSGCSGLTSISIPEEVTSIGDEAFSACSGLRSISIPEGVTRLGTGAFCSCSSLTSISIPKGVTSIGFEAFKYCKSLTSINIPEEVTSIGTRAFYSCSSLTSISLPKGVTSIGHEAFSDCKSLTSINIPEEVTSIGDYAFYSCSSLTSIEWKGEIYNSVYSFLSAFRG